MKAIKILRVFVIFLILHSCIENNDDISVDSDKNNLTPTGKAFIEFIHSNPEMGKNMECSSKKQELQHKRIHGCLFSKVWKFHRSPHHQSERNHTCSIFSCRHRRITCRECVHDYHKDQEQRPEFVRSFFATLLSFLLGK